MGYNFNIQYKPGLENTVADALSRVAPIAEDTTNALFALTIRHTLLLNDIEARVLANETLQRMLLDLKHDPTSRPGYAIVDNHLLYKNQLVLLSNSSIIGQVLREFMMGVLGVIRVFSRRLNEWLLISFRLV